MAEYVPFSEKQKIFTPAQWEEMRFLDMDCQTVQVASQMMRAVVARLLKIDNQYSADNFQFLVYDDNDPNAAYVSGHKTQNGKPVIMISTGITKLCKTEDEFAGVLAHELGHFTYDKIYGKNKNTVFQERFSDLHTADFMIAGGYDPVAYSRVCEHLTENEKAINLFDVHGSDTARKEDVDAYLTKLHQERGVFYSTAPTGLYKNFSRVMSKHLDKYTPYFDVVMKQKFGNAKPSPEDLLDLIVSEIRTGKISNKQRFEDVKDLIEHTKTKKKAMLEKTQFLAERIIRAAYVDGKLPGVSRFGIYELLLSVINNFRNGTAFDIFPPFTYQLEVYHDFMTTRDVEHAKQLAKDLGGDYKDEIREDWLHTFQMQELFGKPYFEMPPRESAVGQMMPTDWLINTGDERCMKMARSLCPEPEYEWVTDAGDNYHNPDLGYKGKILAVSDAEIKNIREQFVRQDYYQKKHQKFRQYMDVLTLLYEFDIGKKSVTDVKNFAIESMQALDEKTKNKYGDSIYSWPKKLWEDIETAIFLGDYEHENSYFEADINELVASPAFTELCIKPFLQSLKQVVHDVDPNLEQTISFDNLPKGKNWVQHATDICNQLGFCRKDQHKNPGPCKNVFELWWNDSRSPVIALASQVIPNARYNVFSKLMSTGVKNGEIRKDVAATFFGMYTGSSQIINKFDMNNFMLKLGTLEDKKIAECNSDSFEQLSFYADAYQWTKNEGLKNIINQEFTDNKTYKFFPRMMDAFGFVMPNNQDELHKMLTKHVYSNDYSFKIARQYLILYYMRKGLPLSNLGLLLHDIEEHGAWDIRFDFHSELTNELSYYIDKYNLMPSDFKSMYDIYIRMEYMNLFSNDVANQAKYLDKMITQLRTMPIEIRKEYVYKLLSGFYYSDKEDEKHQTHYHKNRSSKILEIPLAKKQLMEMYSDDIAEQFGLDDNTDEYFAKIKEFTHFVNEERKIKQAWDNKTRTAFNKPDQGMLYRLISDKIQSQERVSKFLGDDKNIVVSNKDIQSKDFVGRGVEVMMDVLGRYQQLAIYTIEFLNTKLTQKSVDDYCNKCKVYVKQETSYGPSFINTSLSENIYNTFWTSGLEARAVIMNKLLNRAFDTLEERVKYVCDMNFDKDNKYRKDAEMVFDCVIKAFEPYEQNLVLSAVASADENKQAGKNASRSVGDGLRMFFENMGPAWVKFGQLLSYVPELPSEIRHDLGKLKDAADIPARWSLYSGLSNALPNDLKNRIERVEDIIGAGSFWVTAVIRFKNEKGKTEKKVLQLLRPYAAEKSQAGFETIERAIANLSKRDKKYKILQSVAHQAKESAKYEVDVVVGKKQYEKAKELYGDIRVNIDGTTYTPNVADWRYCGSGENKIGYKIMDYAPGATLGKVNATQDERRKMALAYFTIEMTNLFKGDVWDIDRHQGQQNFNIVAPNAVDINIYDTGAQLPAAPDKKNKVLLASVFFGLIKAVQSGQSIDSYILKTIKKLDNLQNKLKIDVSYVSNVQKGLMALSDIMEYQKEIKDSDGNIIQERKTLSETDLKNAIIAVLQNPTVDKYLRVVIAGRMVANKLTHLEIQELKKLANSQVFNDDNPVQIEITKKTTTSKALVFNKGAREINTDKTVLGINTKYIQDPDATNLTVLEELRQIGLAS